MNLATLEGEFLFASFNQNFTSLTIGGHSGYRIFNLKTIDTLEEIHSDDAQDVCSVERFVLSSLVAIVNLATPRQLKVYDFKKNADICNYSYPNSILAVKLNGVRLVVVLEESLFIHNMQNMRLIHTIRGVPPNIQGVCALSGSSDNALLAYPGASHTGEIQIFDAANIKAVTMIHAHHNPIAALAFNADASRLATASDKGTVIRVFSVSDGKRLFEFRRGVARYVSICSLAFSQDSMFLAASSNTETVHLFKLETPATHQAKDAHRQGSESDASWLDYFNKILSTSSTYLPTPVNDILSQDRAFATVKLPLSRTKNICALTTVQKLLRVLVASGDGYLYIYNLNTADGGECSLVRQHKLDFSSKTSNSPNSKETYADAAKGKKQEAIPIKSGPPKSVDSSQQNEIVVPLDGNNAGERLPLDDNKEFPPMTLHCE